MITHRHVHVDVVMKTPQFWLVWAVLCLNVTAGIGIIGTASPLLQEIFAGKLIDVNLGFNDLSIDQSPNRSHRCRVYRTSFPVQHRRKILLHVSDKIGRKSTYYIFSGLGRRTLLVIPALGRSGNLAFFVMSFCIILSMYGGGFATIPAYLADLFGTQMVGAIHGRLLTAWATAGVLGPMLVNYIREYQLSAGVVKAEAYDTTMYILGGLLLIGMACNAAIRPVNEKFFMTDEALAQERSLSHDWKQPAVDAGIRSPGFSLALILAWLAVGIPLVWGITITLQKAVMLFL